MVLLWWEVTPLAKKHLHLAILHLLGLFYHSVVVAANSCFIVLS